MEIEEKKLPEVVLSWAAGMATMSTGFWLARTAAVYQFPALDENFIFTSVFPEATSVLKTALWGGFFGMYSGLFFEATENRSLERAFSNFTAGGCGATFTLKLLFDIEDCSNAGRPLALMFASYYISLITYRKLFC